MTLDEWLQQAREDAARRGLAPVGAVLEALARATRALREADFNGNPAGRPDR